MHDSFTPLGGLVPMWLMQLGEIVFGGVGSGLYGMLMFVIVAVFVAGLMVGRTPEYLGKKIEAYEMKMASLVILIPPLVVLVGTAIAVVRAGAGVHRRATEVKSNLNNPGCPRFFGSAVRVFVGRQQQRQRVRRPHGQRAVLQHGVRAGDVRVAVLADDSDAGDRRFAGRKKYTPPGAGTLPTHRPLFVVMVVGTILLVGALTFVPALALGPIVEHLQMMAGK